MFSIGFSFMYSTPIPAVIDKCLVEHEGKK